MQNCHLRYSNAGRSYFYAVNYRLAHQWRSRIASPEGKLAPPKAVSEGEYGQKPIDFCVFLDLLLHFRYRHSPSGSGKARTTFPRGEGIAPAALSSLNDNLSHYNVHGKRLPQG